MITLPAPTSAGLPHGRVTASRANRVTDAMTKPVLDKSPMDQTKAQLNGQEQQSRLEPELEQKKNINA